MKPDNNTPRDSAIANALSSINKGARLPCNVFTQMWDDYLFFESYMMFDNSFIEAKNTILREEGSSEIALVNLGNGPNTSDVKQSIIFLEKNLITSEYISILKGDGSPLNWIFLMDRYVCASDKGNWCIYCEKENDIAVLAVRNTLPESMILKLRDLLKADSIKTICDSKINRPFDFDKLVLDWKATLITDYGQMKKV